MAETSKSRPRREASGFFDKYVQGKVIDIGVGRIDTHDGSDPLTDWCDTWNKDNGNAELMESVEDNTYDLVYNSHLLEHLDRPELAIMNWMRITKPNGFLEECNRLMVTGGHLIIQSPIILEDGQMDDKMFNGLEHIWIYGIEDLKQLLNGHGFKVLKVDRHQVGHEQITAKKL